MTDSNWSLSSSSEDDEDAHLFQSEIREDSEYYKRFLKKDYGTDDWADHIPQFMNLGLKNNDENRQIFTNISMSNGTTMNILQLPCTVPDRVMVLNRDTNQYEVMRYIEMANGSVITPEPEVNLPDSTSTINGTMASTSTSVHSQNNSFHSQVKGDRKQRVPTPIIPTEPVNLVDLISKTIDRRKEKPTPDFLMELVVPQFYHEFEWNASIDKWIIPKEPKPERNQGFKPSMSYIRERSDRVNLHQQNNDPRFNKDLFSKPFRAHSSKDDKLSTVVGPNKYKVKKDLFGTDSDSSMPVTRSRSPSMSPTFNASNSGSDFAAERNSTVLPGNNTDSGTTASDISLSDSDTFERTTRSRTRKNKKRKNKFEDKENEKVPPLVIKLSKSIDQGHSSKKHPKNKEKTVGTPKLLTMPPTEMYTLKNDVLAAIGGFPDDENPPNKFVTADKCEATVPTQLTESMDMDVDGDAVAGTSANANEQPKENETETKDTSHGLDDISDNEMVNEQPETKNDSQKLDDISDDEFVNEQSEMVSHENLTDLEDVSMEESDADNHIPADLDNFSVDDKMLDEAVKMFENVENRANTINVSDIEKSLALFDDVGSDDINRFVEAKSNEEIDVTPKPVNSQDRNELIKILDPNSSLEQNVLVVPTESGPSSENMQTEQEALNCDVPEIGATADVGQIIDTQTDQINLGECNDLNSFGRPRNMLPDSVDETHRIKITIDLIEYMLAENEQDKQLRDDDTDEEEHGEKQTGEPMDEHYENAEIAEIAQETTIETTIVDNNDQMHRENDNGEMQGDFNIIETSEDDQEYDDPIATENNVVPNSNTDRRVTQTNLKCTMCSYEDLDGWRKLTKHYIRKHPGAEIGHSRLAKRFKLDEIIASPVISTVTDQMLIKSICLFCDQYYCLNSSKWEKHFVSHTGECPYECRECGSKLFDDVHKRCQSMNNIVINGPHEFTQNKLYGYVCKLCNFVQLDKQNINKHIDNQHQAMPNEESIIEIYLINAPVSKPFDPDAIAFIQVDSDEEVEIKSPPKCSATTEKSPNVSENVVDLTLSDSDE